MQQIALITSYFKVILCFYLNKYKKKILEMIIFFKNIAIRYL